MGNFLAELGRFVAFSGRVIGAMPTCLWSPRWLLIELVRGAAGCLPIALVIGVAIGLVAWMHLGEILARYDSSAYLPATLMLAVVLEVGPVCVGLLAASRLATGMSAELAAMNATEQIDALIALGVCPFRRLLAPRVLSAALLLPALAVLVDYAALAASFLAESLASSVGWDLYWRQAIEPLSLLPAVLATAKTVVFGFAVGLIACYLGCRSAPSASAVGTCATRSVVACTLTVLCCDVILVRVIQWFS